MTDETHWFSEPPHAGQRPCLEVRERLYHGRSRYQEIEVLDTVLFGRMLVLDEMIQTTERDEFCYHEMLVHPAMLAHPAPRRALVIGGGDGGALRRVLQHPVERALLVEIDQQVVEVCRKFLPSVSAGAFEDPRAELRFEDGLHFLATTDERFDVVVVDAPDPIGPGRQLYTQGFYQGLARVLAPGGMLAVQCASPLLLPAQMAQTYLGVQAVLPATRVYLGAVPAYPGVMWAFVLATSGGDLTPPIAQLEERMQARGLCTQYYTPALHHAAFALPSFVQRFLADAERSERAIEQHPLFPAVEATDTV